MASPYKRLLLLSNHLQSSPKPDNSLLFSLYFGAASTAIPELRAKAESSPFFVHKTELPMQYHQIRERTLSRISTLYDKQARTLEDDIKNPLNKLSMMYVFSEYDKATTTRILVHNILFIDSIQFLGSSKHQNAIHRAYRLEDYGCFAMTELGHGSNVLGLETTATYIHETREFEINSPSATSAKWWIGAAGKTANVAVVFAQMVVAGENKGVHAFYVRIRDENHGNLDGVVVGDCGPKIALNAVDNGFILFRKYRVPYCSLLDRFSEVNEQGHFKSSIKNKEKRFGTMMAGLIRGRLSVISSSEISIRASLCICYRFLSQMQSPQEGLNLRKLDDQLSYSKIIPILSSMFAIRSSLNHLLELFSQKVSTFSQNPESEELSEYHMLISTLKPVSSWISSQAHEDLQDLCGHYSNYLQSSISRIKSNQDINTTWEGDNSVLIQQVGKYVFKQIKNTYKGIQIKSELLSEALMTEQDFSSFSIKHLKVFNLNDLLACLKYRFNYFVYNSLHKLQENVGKFESVNEAWNQAQVFHIQDIGKSLGDFILFKTFQTWLLSFKEKSQNTFKALEKLLKVFALNRIIQGSIELIATCLSSNQVLIMKNELLRECFEMKDFGLELLNVLAPPDYLLYSDIGESKGNIFDRIYERALELNLN